MDLEKKLEQLTFLMSDLVPSVDQLIKNESSTKTAIEALNVTIEEFRGNTNQSIAKLNLGVSELRQSNMKLADVIEKLTQKIDKIDEFEQRLRILETKVL